MQIIPNQQGQLLQPNQGTVAGNILASYAVDLFTNKGKIKVSIPSIKAVDETDDADFNQAVGSITEYNNDLWAGSDRVFVQSSGDPTGTWAQDAGASATSPGTGRDMVVFNGALIVRDGTDVSRYTGSWTTDWWTGVGELNQSAFASNNPQLAIVGPDNNLYLSDATSGTVNKLYRVKPDDTVSTSGGGTLDFSSTPYSFTSKAVTSNRIWIGCENTEGGQGAIIEWDAAPDSVTANRVHRIDANKVLCIAVWNDTPIAILSNGNVVYFNGSGFTDFPNIQLPYRHDDKELDDDFVHRNGWAIIDGLPHFLMSSRTDNQVVSTSIQNGLWTMPSGVYCLDPDVGLYNRFPIGSGLSTQKDAGVPVIREVGALYATKDATAKFLASIEYRTSTSADTVALVYQDKSKSDNVNAFLATTAVPKAAGNWNSVELYHRKLGASDKIKLYYRFEEADGFPVGATITWTSTTTFTSTTDLSDVSAGNVVLITAGPGAGVLHVVSSISEAGGTYTVTVTEANPYSANTDTGYATFVDYKHLATIEDTVLDRHEFEIPDTSNNREIYLLVEMKQAANSTIEIDRVIIE